jgi:eukaryotic-like serine/threonine-protein kinase
MVDPTALTDPGQSPRPASPAEVPTPTGDRPPPPADPMLAQVLDGKYRLDAVLARGGSGRIYVGRQLSLDRPVAIKVLRSDLEGDDEQRFEERFFREASMAGQLQHPHVVTVHDYGRAETGVLYIAMELLGGRSLKERMSEGPMPPDEALPIFEQIVRGLRHAHRAGLVHRDMKPGNVQLVPGEDGVAFAKILDFGLVRGGDGDAEITRDGYFVGTPHYAAPEQVRGVAWTPGPTSMRWG